MAHGSPQRTRPAPLPAGRRAVFLAVPWLFVGVLLYVAWHVILPGVQHGAIWAYIVAPLFAVVVCSFLAAAVSISRDLLSGRSS